MLKKLHLKLVDTFDKFYSMFFLYIWFGFFIVISLIGEHTLGNKLQLLCGFICILAGIAGLIKSYKSKNKS
ncbi:hypothetical protein [Clostridium botulinum]|uniref:hypothetical protein n=1 Tax=Clostridium botulinum TaxID=1491 RepID=UPI0019689BB3|nr:hypothetical protein [Clostridium botulinum]MBN1059170.1 hypothetical protein [Clostridium botulinum]MBN1062341.1 hypothetical protein [Clostridium botulinum]